MAAEPVEVTPNYDCDTEGNGLEHLLEDVHEILRIIRKIATPEAQAMLDGFLTNPALKWKARRARMAAGDRGDPDGRAPDFPAGEAR